MLKTGKIYQAKRKKNLHRGYCDYITMQILWYAAGQFESRKNCMFILNHVADLMRDMKILFALLGIKTNNWWICEDREPPVSQRKEVLSL